MNHYAIIDAAGHVTGRGATPAPIHVIEPPPGGRVVPLAADTPPGAALYFNGMLVRQAPPAPSPHHRLVPIKGTWQLDEEAARAAVRAERVRLLDESDWVRLRANDLGESVPQAWLDYRQALRDVTEQPGFPEEVVWPVAPAA